MKESLPRLIDIVFGDSFLTPTVDEQAMYFAHSASLRSAEMGRQVGAAIIVEPFQCVATGVNEVPSPIGRTYFPGDDPDGRDFAQEPALDSNTEWKRRVARELVARLISRSWLESSKISTAATPGRERSLEELIQAIPEDLLQSFLDDVDGTRLSDLIEFGRAVHAEMDAITSAARRGISIDGGTLFSTTFPCHTCVRHIITAGLKRVVFMHPYAKSLAYELHGDAVQSEGQSPPQRDAVVFEQFTGVAPRLFAQFFDMGSIERKDDDTGEALRQERSDGVIPRPLRSGDTFTFGGPIYPAAVLTVVEDKAATRFATAANELELTVPG